MSDPVPRLNAALEGRYGIERELGEGGMATVYLADSQLWMVLSSTGAHRLLEDLPSYPYVDPEILERARDYSEEVKSDQHPPDEHPAQSRRMDAVLALAALAEEIIGFAEGSHGRRSTR